MFIPVKYFDGEPDPWENLPIATGKTVHVGTALAFSSGKLDIASATTIPEYICMEEAAGTVAGQTVNAIRVSPDTLYETTLSVQSTSIEAGKKYTIDTKGEMITATDTSGVAEVVSFEGTAAGSKVRVHF